MATTTATKAPFHPAQAAQIAAFLLGARPEVFASYRKANAIEGRTSTAAMGQVADAIAATPYRIEGLVTFADGSRWAGRRIDAPEHPAMPAAVRICTPGLPRAACPGCRADDRSHAALFTEVQ